MTIKELYDSVAQLGFETSLEDNDRFYLAVNRAIIQINRLRPKTKVYELSHFPIDNLLGNDKGEPVSNDDEALIFVADGAKAYYFECNGNGTLIIEKNIAGDEWAVIGSETLTSADGNFTKYRGFIKDGSDFYTGTVRLRFAGDYVLWVKNVAMYDKLRSEKVTDIPDFSEYVAYDFASLANDFASFVRPPIADAGQNKGFVLDSDYFVSGDATLLIPASVKGSYSVRYNRKISSINQDENAETTNIDLDDDLCAILPNLVAAYIWADDEPTKAEYYLSLYREQAAEIYATAKKLEPVVYRNRNGW
jgi:hypothetical protein